MEHQPAIPQPIDDLLRHGFHLFRTGLKEILGILLLQTISILVLFVVLFSLTVSLLDNTAAIPFQPDFILCVVLSSLVVLAIQLGFIATFTTKFWAIAHHTTTTAAHAYAVGIKKALPLLAWLITYLVLVSLGLVVLFVPGLLLMVSLFMGAALIIQDHYSVLAAIKASHQLVWPYLRRTLLYLFLSISITLAIYFATIYPLGLFISYLTGDNPMLSGIFDLARYALIVMLVPLFVALIIPYYMELLQLQKNRDAT